jgi:hypothetical protein
MNNLMTAALEYAQLGWRVHPLRPDGKEPLLRHGVHDASNDHDQIRCWWTRWPNANIGVATGAESIDVLDIDVKFGGKGLHLAEQARDAGLLSGWIGVVESPSGGLHIWYPGTDQGGGAVGKKRDLELKSIGGYVLVPPSYVICRDKDTGAPLFEGVYRLTKTRDRGATLDWQAIKQLLAPPRPVVQIRDWKPGKNSDNFDGLVRRVADQGPRSGNRNSCLFWAACRAIEGNAPPAVYRDLAAAAIANGLPERDAWATVASAQRTTRGAA